MNKPILALLSKQTRQNKGVLGRVRPLSPAWLGHKGGAFGIQVERGGRVYMASEAAVYFEIRIKENETGENVANKDESSCNVYKETTTKSRG